MLLPQRYESNNEKMKSLPQEKKRLKKIKYSKLMLDLEFDEWQCLTVFVHLKVGGKVGQDFHHPYCTHVKNCAILRTHTISKIGFFGIN